MGCLYPAYYCGDGTSPERDGVGIVNRCQPWRQGNSWRLGLLVRTTDQHELQKQTIDSNFTTEGKQNAPLCGLWLLHYPTGGDCARHGADPHAVSQEMGVGEYLAVVFGLRLPDSTVAFRSGDHSEPRHRFGLHFP